MRTMFTEFPDDESTLAMDDQWMVGQSLLVKPVTNPGQKSVDVYLPGKYFTTQYSLYVLFVCLSVSVSLL